MMRFVHNLVLLLTALYFANGAKLPQTRVIGGDDAEQSDFYFVTSLRTITNDYLCGGAIIDDYWVITAAECVHGKTNNSLIVVVGTVTLSGGGSLYMIKEAILHSGFNPETKENNIALLKVTNRIIFNNYVNLIPLANKELGNGKTVELSGWGTTEKSNFTDTLQVAKLTLLTIDKCKQNFPEDYTLFENNICSKGESSMGACIGDMGSPLIQRGGIIFGKTELHGIVSQWNCANGYPDVYVAIVPFKSWIEGILEM